MYTYKSIKKMPLPTRQVPDYEALTEDFNTHVYNQANGIRYIDTDGNTYFTAYSEGKGNEMVTWGILAVSQEEPWPGMAKTFENYFHPKHKIYMNTPGSTKTEYWYLLYVNTLAGVVYRCVFPDCKNAYTRMLESAESLQRMAVCIGYDFNDQGYDFTLGKAWTNKDIYRQPDTIGGYAYNMLFAGLHGKRDDFIAEAVKGIKLYESFENNPWYEIPNGGTAVLAAAWLKSKGHDINLEKILGYVLDTEEGPLQTGHWNGESVDGLMMGWRGDDRAYAIASAYSMETLMPLPFLLPAVKYVPEMAKSITKYALNAVANFDLFYGRGLYETRPDLSSAVPYEKLERERDGHSPAACGDFMGHRSVYGGGYLSWTNAIMRPTGCEHMPAWDISITDWLDTEAQAPTFLLYNHENVTRTGSFTPSPWWYKKRPDLTPGEEIEVSVSPNSMKIITL
ncbi:MAG: hypothetical protein FWC73_00445 [Defluviitaleaceae bacterium]|nr:hypothetical protein [Defluviitaleaceae bacterium]